MAVHLLARDPEAPSGEYEGGAVGLVARLSNYNRPAILILLRENDCHGYELVQRMAELGLGPLVAAAIYGVLRSMEADGLVTSWWDTRRRGGPPRRVYAKTAEGEAYLRDMAPVLSQQRDALGAMLERYRSTDTAED